MSLERLEPFNIADDDIESKESYALHLERYDFAAQIIANHHYRVLDIACGVGYGTKRMSDKCGTARFTGVDISENAISVARSRYDDSRITFVHSDIATFSSNEMFDCVVSLETLEHIQRPADALRKFHQLLRPDGILITSVPTTPSTDINIYHLHDFTKKSFLRLLNDCGFSLVNSLEQIQKVDPLNVIRSTKGSRSEDRRQNLLKYYLQNPSMLVKRAKSIATDGFNNLYMTVAAKKL